MHIKRFAGQDEGFALAEVVVAAAILFFVLTAMVGLVGASQTMSVMAKHKTTVTNATAEHIDRIRALAFDKIATPPTGLVPSSETVTYHGHDIEFKNHVVMSDGEGGKYLRTVYVQTSAIIQGRTYKTSATVHIKNPNNDTTAASVIDENAPTVWFTDDSAPENGIVFDDRLWTGPSTDRSLELEASAESTDDTIESMVFGGSGAITPEAFVSGPSVTLASAWDTTGIADGLTKVVVQATDSQARNSVAERQFIVDNAAPGAPGAPVVTAQTSSETRIRFDAAPDPVPASGQQPITFASSYRYSLRKSPTYGGSDPLGWYWLSSTTEPAGASLLDSIFTAGPIARTVPTDAYSRYYMRLRALSPRGLSSTRVPFFFVSAPEVGPTGTCTTTVTKKGSIYTATYAVTMYLVKPTFPVSSAAYTYQAKPVGGAWSTVTPSGATVTTDTNYTKHVFAFTRTYKSSPASESLWFRVGVNVTPSDGLGGAYVVSNALGRSTALSGTGATTATLSETSWTE